MPASMTVEELLSQLCLIKSEMKERNVDSLSASEKLSREFLSLNLPAETEVYHNLCPGQLTYVEKLN